MDKRRRKENIWELLYLLNKVHIHAESLSNIVFLLFGKRLYF